MTRDDGALDREPATQADRDGEIHARLERWLAERGARLAPLRLGRSADGERGVRAAASIAAGEIVMDVPRRCILTPEVARASRIGREIDASGVTLRSRRTYLAALLLAEGGSRASQWAPYLDTLPTSFRHMPVLFDDRELSLLAGSAALERVRVRRAALAEELEVCRAIPALRAFGDAELSRAWLAVDTRVFGMTMEGAKTEGLVPLADLLNHAIPRETSWSYDDGSRGFRVIALRDFAEGDPVHDSYGVKCRARYFVNYGFVPGSGAEDEVVIRPRIAPRTGSRAGGSAAWFRVQPTYRSALTRQMFSALRVARGAPPPAAGEHAAPSSAANEEAVLAAVAEACDEALSAFPTTAAEDDALLASAGLPPIDRACVRVRRGEKRALAELLELAAWAACLLRMPGPRARREAAERRPADGRFDDYLASLLDLPRRARRSGG